MLFRSPLHPWSEIESQSRDSPEKRGIERVQEPLEQVSTLTDHDEVVPQVYKGGVIDLPCALFSLCSLAPI